MTNNWLATGHIISYGTLFGTQLFHSFISGPLAFKSLPRPQFATLQSAIFPVYFALQTTLPVLLALTYPGTSISSASTLGNPTGSIPSGFAGVLDSSNTYSVLVPLALTFASGLLNWAVVGPATTKTMKERKHQETRDGKKYFDAGPHSEAMKKLNKKFGMLHGVSSIVNLVALLATGYYASEIAGRMH